jgi:hypothetical protein
VLALLEAQRHFGDDRYGDAAVRGAAAIAAAVREEEGCSLYFGLAGHAVALHEVHVQLGDPSSATAARFALSQVRSRFDGQRWGVMFELLGGNAGIALGALQAGDPELAVLAAAGAATGRRDLIELLGSVTRDAAWGALADRCWHTVTHCGLPRRIRPGFWDNSGHCCGTAGVLALACDRHAGQAADLASPACSSRTSRPGRPSTRTACAGQITSTA